MVGLCPQLDKTTWKSKLFFGPGTKADEPQSSPTSINASEILRALGVDDPESTHHVMLFNIDNPGIFCNKTIHLVLDQQTGLVLVNDHCMMASTDVAYEERRIILFYQGMIHSARTTIVQEQSRTMSPTILDAKFIDIATLT
jgi:flagellar basal body P-ring protein FlgI